MDFAAFRDGLADDADGHLMLVDNPDHHPQGDFSLVGNRLALSEQRLTYSGIGLFRTEPSMHRRTRSFRFVMCYSRFFITTA